MFDGAATHYDRFMGRYSGALAVRLADAAGIGSGQQVLDVGCEPGALTGVLAERVGAGNVAAIDPSPGFARACAQRHPGADVRAGGAEHLPWPDGRFDAALACLVVAFMDDPDRGIREMARVTRPGGTVAACMWDVTEGMTMLAAYWNAARAVHPDEVGERGRPGTEAGDIARRFAAAGLTEVVDGSLTVQVHYPDFEDFFEPLTHGVGTVGAHLAAQSEADRADIRERLRSALPRGAFTLDARAWYARGTVARADGPDPGTAGG